MPRLHLLAVLALLGALLVAALGCGGKSDREKFVDEVNGICGDLESSLERLENRSTSQEEGRQARRLIPAVDRAVKRLANVEASPDVKKELGDEYLQFVATFRAQAIAYGGIVGAAETNDQRKLRSLIGQLAELNQSNDRRARKLGFDDCADDQG